MVSSVPPRNMHYDELAIQTKALLHAIPGDLASLEHRILSITSLNQSAEITKLAKSVEANIYQVSTVVIFSTFLKLFL